MCKRVYILDTLDCDKDIMTNIEDSLAFAKKHINLTYLINAEVMREQGNATRKEVLEIPEDVLKEAIINRYWKNERIDERCRTKRTSIPI